VNPSLKKHSILLIAGEASGDIHGASLIHEIKTIKPDIDFFGIGGDRMKMEGFEAICHTRDMSFLGFFEVLKHLPFIRKIFRQMINLLEKRNPSLILLIDYPGFNLRFARQAKKRGFQVVYYISPQVWAWGSSRVKKIVRWVDRMIVFFPFEEEIYQNEGMDVQFIGHPLKDEVNVTKSKTDFFQELGFDPQKPTIGILPGSRNQEVLRILPEMMKSLPFLHKNYNNLQGIIGMAPALLPSVYEPYVNSKYNVITVKDRIYEVMKYSDVVMVASGTATLETAILGTPMVILYKMAWASYLIGKMIVKVKYVGLVNIVGGRKIVPELLQGKAKGKRIALEIMKLLSDQEKREEIKKGLNEVSGRLGEKGAAKRAAKAVVELLTK